MANYFNIFEAHRVAKKALMLHGSSGYGKSSTIYAYAKKAGLHVIEKRTCYIDPMDIKIPKLVEEDKVVDFWPARWLKQLCGAQCEPTILFLDEFSRPASAQTFAMFTELLLDRAIDGVKLNPNVMILGATNIESEDIGVVPIPDAVLKRLTNIVFAPTELEITLNMRSEMAKKLLLHTPSVLSKPGIAEFNLNGCPRQIDDVCELWETELLTEDDLHIVAKGRLGLERGSSAASSIISLSRNLEQRLPPACLPEHFGKLIEYQNQGGVIEIGGFLKSEALDTDKIRHVCDFLLQHGSKELVRMVKDDKSCGVTHYTYAKDQPPLTAEGKPYTYHATHAKAGQEIVNLSNEGHLWIYWAVSSGAISAMAAEKSTK